MRARGTVVLLALFLLLAGYIYVVERRQLSDEAQEAQDRVVLDVEQAAIVGFQLAWRESTIALARRDDRWFVTEPLSALADAGVVGRLIAVADSLSAERLIPMADVDSAATGLAEPWLRFVVTVADSARHEIEFGNMNPTGSAYYARVDHGSDLALLSTIMVDRDLKPTLTSLRDRRLMRFDPEAARRIEIASAERTLELAADSGTWLLVHPSLPADQHAVRSFLSRLADLQASAFHAEQPGPADLARCGLDTPSMTAIIKGERDSLLGRIAWGARTEHSGHFEIDTLGELPGRFALASAQRAIVVVPEKNPAELMPSLFALRDKRLVDLGPAEIDTLEVAGGGHMVVAARDSTGRMQPLGDVGPELAADIDQLAANLPHVLVTKFADETAVGPSALRRFGLDPGHLRLRLRLSDGETRVILLGDADPGGNGVFAHRLGTPGVVVVGHATAGDLIQLVHGTRTPPSAGGN